MSSNLETNKIFASLLVAGIAFGALGVIADSVVHPKELEHSVLKIAGLPAAASAPTEAPKPIDAIEPLLAKADPAAGEAEVKKVCSACHNFAEGAGKKVGPDLYDVVGRPIASTDGFDYSPGLKAVGGNWTYEELNHWLFKPSAMATGTKMAFAGISNDATRADVIDYLRTLSHSPVPLPASK